MLGVDYIGSVVLTVTVLESTQDGRPSEACHECLNDHCLSIPDRVNFHLTDKDMSGSNCWSTLQVRHIYATQ